MAGVPHLKDLTEKYRERGFEIIATSNEDPAKVQEWIDKNHPVHGITAKSPGRREYSKMGRGLPRCTVVDPDGNVKWAGQPQDVTDAMVEEWLKDVPTQPITREVDSKLRTSVKAYNKGELGKAWEKAGKYAEDEDEQRREDAQFIIEKVEKAVEWAKTAHARMRETKDFVRLLERLEQDAEVFDGMEFADACDDAAGELKRSDEYKLAEKAEQVLTQIKDARMDDADRYRELGELIEEYPDTRAADEARRMRESLKK